MADITPVRATVAGTNLNPAAASGGGDAVLNKHGNVILRIANGSGSPINVTIAAQQTARPADGPWPAQTLANVVVAVPATDAMLIGPIPSAFNDAAGKVQLTYSGVSSLTVEAYEPP